jgi:ABC-type uncharacterized transport system permease subunit
MAQRYSTIFSFGLVIVIFLLMVVLVSAVLDVPSVRAEGAFTVENAVTSAVSTESTVPWWIWPLSLFFVTFVLGILAGRCRRRCAFRADRKRILPISS